jgi:hypothetical protein
MINDLETVTLEKLQGMLAEELTQQDELLALLQEEQQFIASGSAENLRVIIAALEACVQRLVQTRLRRDQLRQELAVAVGLSSTSSFGQLIDRTPRAFQRRLAEQLANINIQLARSQRWLRQNQALMASSMEQMQKNVCCEARRANNEPRRCATTSTPRFLSIRHRVPTLYPIAARRLPMTPQE